MSSIGYEIIMKRSVLSLALGFVTLVTVLAVRHVPRADDAGDQAGPDSLRESGAI